MDRPDSVYNDVRINQPQVLSPCSPQALSLPASREGNLFDIRLKEASLTLLPVPCAWESGTFLSRLHGSEPQQTSLHSSPAGVTLTSLPSPTKSPRVWIAFIPPYISVG